MSRTPTARSVLASAFPRLARLCLLGIAVLSLPVLAVANPLPDAMVYFHVRPAGPPQDACVTDITHCRDMTASTDQEGMIEIQVFVDPQQGYWGPEPVEYFTAELSWPDAWTLMDFRPCGDPIDWWIEASSPNPHPVYVQWPCMVPDGMFLAFTLRFDVHGYGIVDTPGACYLGLGCPSNPIEPTAGFAEAGTGCAYTNEPCAWWAPRCIANVEGLQLELSAPEGGTAHGELEFTIQGYPYPRCDYTAHSSEPWATGYVVSDNDLYHAVLYVDVDAAGLAPGVHEAEMQIAYDGMYNGGPVHNARCLPVILTVDPVSAVEDRYASHDPAARGALAVAGPNPSSGPFVFAYEILTTSRVRCDVFDASGRAVTKLIDEEKAAGTHSVTWRAKDAAGRRVGPGVYLVRLAGGGQRLTTRVVVVE